VFDPTVLFGAIHHSTHFDLHIHNKCEVKMAKATHSYQGYLDFGVSTVAFFVAFVKAFKVEVFSLR